MSLGHRRQVRAAAPPHHPGRSRGSQRHFQALHPCLPPLHMLPFLPLGFNLCLSPSSTCLQGCCQKGLVSIFHSKSDIDENSVKKQNFSHSPYHQGFSIFQNIVHVLCSFTLHTILCSCVYKTSTFLCHYTKLFFYYNEITTYVCTYITHL